MQRAGDGGQLWQLYLASFRRVHTCVNADGL